MLKTEAVVCGKLAVSLSVLQIDFAIMAGNSSVDDCHLDLEEEHVQSWIELCFENEDQSFIDFVAAYLGDADIADTVASLVVQNSSDSSSWSVLPTDNLGGHYTASSSTAHTTH